jgi:uncharacterized protein with HEPN domain
MGKAKEIYLSRMLESIHQIETYVEGLSAEDFDQNRLVSDACLMQFQHLGETAGKYKIAFPEDTSLPFREIVEFRNFIAHEYLGIELIDVWDTIENDLPELRKKLNNNLKK